MGVGEEATATAAEAAPTTAAQAATAGGGQQETPGQDGQCGTGPQDTGGLERSEERLTPRQSLTITLLRNVRYHEDREAFFTLVNRLLNIAVLLSGTGVVATLTTSHHGWSRIIAILTAIIGAVQLVFDPSRRQFQHENLRVRFLELLSDLTDETLLETRRGAQGLYSQEPPTFYAADALAFNAGQKALARPTCTLRVVTRWQRLMKNWVRFTDTEFRERGDDPPKVPVANPAHAATRCSASPSPSNSAST